jgi:hypothetical protein
MALQAAGGILLSPTQADGRPMAWAELSRAVGAGGSNVELPTSWCLSWFVTQFFDTHETLLREEQFPCEDGCVAAF